MRTSTWTRYEQYLGIHAIPALGYPPPIGRTDDSSPVLRVAKPAERRCPVCWQSPKPIGSWRREIRAFPEAEGAGGRRCQQGSLGSPGRVPLLVAQPRLPVGLEHEPEALRVFPDRVVGAV